MLKSAFFAFVLTASLLLNGCNIKNSDGGNDSGNIKGSGNMKSETRNVSGFKKINAGSAVILEISVQRDFSIVVEGDENLLQYVLTEAKDETLNITTKGKISLTNKVKVKISMPELVDLEVSGASEASVSDVKTESVKLDANGASKIKISGEVKNLKAKANGASVIDAENLKSENAEIETNGTSTATVALTKELNAEANGASEITYVGEPKTIKQNASGASSIKKK